MNDILHGNRVLIYSHDSFGLGHLRRCRTIAHALVDEFAGLKVLIVSGSPIIGSFDFNVRGDLIKSIREHMHGRGIFWALESASSVEYFEDVMVMESGKILEQGSTQELMSRDGPLKALLAT